MGGGRVESEISPYPYPPYFWGELSFFQWFSGAVMVQLFVVIRFIGSYLSAQDLRAGMHQKRCMEGGGGWGGRGVFRVPSEVTLVCVPVKPPVGRKKHTFLF